jgi:cytochrome bd-type quinol oxidase subunit 2
MDEFASFLKYNYQETKELCLHFLTLVTAVLVFSLNFAEKVFNFQNSTKRKRLSVIIAWCLFILSIISCGIGLAFNALAGGKAVSEDKSYEKFAGFAEKFILVAGGVFIIGLIFTIISAVNSSNLKTKTD